MAIEIFDADTLVCGILENARQQIVRNIQTNGITASGRTENNIVVKKYDGGVKLVLNEGVGLPPLGTLESGRKSGKIPMSFTAIIEQWSIDKGLQFETDKERLKFAGAVAWGKIRERGYGRPSSSDYGNRANVIYTPVIEYAKNSINEELKKAVANGMYEIIRNTFKITTY